MSKTEIESRLAAIIHAYDIRGVIPSQLDEELSELLGRAFARFIKSKQLGIRKILCGRDMRVSGKELSRAFCGGAMTEGMDVIDLGLISSDMLYFASGHLDLPGAVFTASHNPPEYNGIKLCAAQAAPIGKETGLAEIKDIAGELAGSSELESSGSLSSESGSLSSESARGELEPRDMLKDYVNHIKSQVDFNSLAPLKVVADVANGMGGLVVPAVLEDSNLELDLMYGDLDGSFPNHPPNPLNPKNLKDLIKKVKKEKADLGLAFDGDADRVFLVDDKGSPLNGSLTTALIASHILSQHPGEIIAYNLICSKTVPEIIAKLGGKALKTRVGHSYIKSDMAESGAVFAGEHSGHYYFRSNFGADSGMIAAVMIMELMTKSGKPLSQLRKPFEKYTASGEINFKAGDPQALIEAVSRKYEQYPQESLDGLTVDLDSWWFNLRPSNTEPLVRLNLEAASRSEFKRRSKEVRNVLNRLIT